jgi:plasmid stability protein
MTSITIRDLDDALSAQLRSQAANHGKSIEEEARDILRSALGAEPAGSDDLLVMIRGCLEPHGGADLPPIKREPVREPPRFE